MERRPFNEQKPGDLIGYRIYLMQYARAFVFYYDVMARNRFVHCWTFLGKSSGHRWIPITMGQ